MHYRFIWSHIFSFRLSQLNYLGLLHSLQNTSYTAHAPFWDALPSSEALEKICARNISDTVIKTCQIQLQDPVRACILLFRLISLILTATTEDTSLIAFLPLNSRLSWALDCVARVHEILNHPENESGPLSFKSELNTLLLQILRSVVGKASRRAQDAPSFKAATLLCQLEASLLGYPAEYLDERLQNELSTALLDAAHAIETHDYSVAAFDTILIPATRSAAEDDTRFETLSRNLQVRIAEYHR